MSCKHFILRAKFSYYDRCENAMYICREKPPLTTVFSETHQCNCWLYQKKEAEQNG